MMLQKYKKAFISYFWPMSSEAEALLKSLKLRKTPLRKKVLTRFLASPHSALSTTVLEEDFSDADRVTLYRTLKTFEKDGLIHRVVDTSQITKYALCHQCDQHQEQVEHAHFLCDSCGETYCLDDIKEIEFKLPAGFLLDKMNLSLSGTCNQCN